MPLGAPAIIGPVSTCSNKVRVIGQFSGARVRIFLEGDPNPIGNAITAWADAFIDIDQSRLISNRKIVASQELGPESSDKSPKGQLIEPAINGPVSIPHTVYACAQSLFVTNCCPGARIEVWQSGTQLGSADAIGDEAVVVFSPGRRISAAQPPPPIEVRQFICTSLAPVITAVPVPLAPPSQHHRLSSPSIVEPLEECQRLVPVEQIISGAVVRLTQNGQVIFDGSRPFPVTNFVVGSMRVGDEYAVSQAMPLCELQSSEPRSARVQHLKALKPPRIDGPVCAGAHQIFLSRLKPGATVRVFASGTELGRWQAGASSMPIDISVVTPATLTAQQDLCGIVSPMSRPYTIASDRSGRWFVAEDVNGDDLKARSFAIHVALTYPGKIVMFSGDQHNSAQNRSSPQDLDHCELFDCASLTIQKIDAPTTDVFCSGHAMMADGRLLVAGGTEDFPPGTGMHFEHFPGLRNTWMFNPTANQAGRHWSQMDSTRGGRWYPTLLTLPERQVLAISGHPEEADRNRHNNNSLEMFSSGTWAFLGDSPDIDSDVSRYLYPRVFVGPTGDVFTATPLKKEFPQDPGRSGTVRPGVGVNWNRSAGPVGNAWGAYDGFNTPAVLLPLFEDGDQDRCFRFQVLLAGDASPWVADLGTPRVPVAHPVWRAMNPRSRRLNSNLVLLPSGEVLLSGGVANPQDDNTAVSAPEMLVFSGGGWQWDAAAFAAAKIPKNYHSTALLMPDGRVFTGGSNVNSAPGDENMRRLELEIYEPWYICRDRPRIIAAPASVQHGHRLTVTARSTERITRIALVRAGSATHSFNPDQRYIGLLANETTPGTYTCVVPDSVVAIAGYYLLFVCTESNVPSKGVFLKIDKAN